MDRGIQHDPEINDLPTVAGVRIGDALSLWRSWHLDIPPTGSTGDCILDRRLADAFRVLAALPSRDDRFTWIERQVFNVNHFVPVGAPATPYQDTLMRWWLALFDTE